MKSIFITLFLVTTQFVYGQNTEKAVVLNAAGSSIIKLMQHSQEFNTEKNFNAALDYLNKAEEADPENEHVINNLGKLYYNWTVSLAAKSSNASGADFDDLHKQMTVCGERAEYYLKKYEAIKDESSSTDPID